MSNEIESINIILMEEVFVIPLKNGVGYKLVDLPDLQPYLEIGYKITDHVIAPPVKSDSKEYCHIIITLSYEDKNKE